MFQHPTRKYQKFVKEHASDDFSALKAEAEGDELKFKYLKKKECQKVKTRMRVNSHFHGTVAKKMFMELKPKVMSELTAICDLMFSLKIVDMGNACYVDKHYSDVIQTREYRSPEVMLEGEYDETADIWSLACMVFELATGDYLFDPKKGKTYTKNDDHLATISELIGECKDASFLSSCESANNFYDRRQKLKRIKKLKSWKLKDILVEKYRVKDTEALFLSRFLERCLKWNPKDRASAKDLLNDPWLKMAPHYDARMDPAMYNEWMKCINPDFVPSDGESSSSSSEEEDRNANEDDKSSWTASDGGRSSQESDMGLDMNRSLSK